MTTGDRMSGQEDCVLVPMEPTTEMTAAGASILCRMELAFATEEYWAKEVYRAMLSAAPASPQPQGADTRKELLGQIKMGEENQYECECFKCGKHFIGNRVHICPDCRAAHPQPSGDGLSDEIVEQAAGAMFAVDWPNAKHGWETHVADKGHAYVRYMTGVRAALEAARAVEARVRSHDK